MALDWTNIKSVTFGGEEMKSLSVNGEEIWSGRPDDLYIIENGVNKTGVDWTKSSSRARIYWYAGVKMRVSVESSPYGRNAWQVYPQRTFDVTEYNYLHVIVCETQQNRSGWNTSFGAVIGDKTMDFGAGVTSNVERVLDISDLTGEVSFRIAGTNYGDSATSQTIHFTGVVSAWLSAD